MMANDLHTQKPSAKLRVHLYAGPLDGLELWLPIDTIGYCHEASRSTYYYCEQTTQRLAKLTFTHSPGDHLQA